MGVIRNEGVEHGDEESFDKRSSFVCEVDTEGIEDLEVVFLAVVERLRDEDEDEVEDESSVVLVVVVAVVSVLGDVSNGRDPFSPDAVLIKSLTVSHVVFRSQFFSEHSSIVVLKQEFHETLS